MSPNRLTLTTQRTARTGSILLTFLVLMTLVLAACGGGTTSNNTTKKHVLTVGTQSFDYTAAGYNPYNAKPNSGLLGLVYETLYFSNVNDGTFTPWLATSYQWNKDLTQLTFTTRSNVKWNDNQAFSANDVAFTFNLMKQYPATDINGVWAFLQSVTASDANTVVMTFKGPNPTKFWYVGSQVFIVPQHIFSSVGDPAKYAPTGNPVGTGPFVLGRHSTDIAVYEKNPSYWQANMLKVDEVRYPVYKDNDAFKLALPKGDIDWGGYFQSDLQTAFVGKDPAHNHYWMAPVDLFSLFVNQKNPLLGQVAVRQAINAAIDRDSLSKQGEAGLAPPVNATGLVLPTAQAWLDPAYANLSNSPDTAKAEKFLTDAGFAKGSDGIYAKNGQRLSFSLISVATYSDWNQMAQIIQQNLKSVGIELKINEIAESNYYATRGTVSFDLMIAGVVGGYTPYFEYAAHMATASIPPNGANFGRWSDPATDKLLQQYASTTDQAVQKQAISGLEKIYVDQLPSIPLVAGPRWAEYRTTNFTGWPDQSNPYATASPFSAPDDEVVILHLQPAS